MGGKQKQGDGTSRLHQNFLPLPQYDFYFPHSLETQQPNSFPLWGAQTKENCGGIRTVLSDREVISLGR